MDSTEAPVARQGESAKPTSDATVSASAPDSDILNQNTVSSTANNNLKDLSLHSFTDTSAPTSSEPTNAPTTNGVNGLNGVKVPRTDLSGSAPAVNTSETTAAAQALDDGDTVMTVEYTEPQAEAIAPPSDPVVKQPTSDLRSPTAPVTSKEQMNDIKEAKQLSDLASDRELAIGMAQSFTAPIKRSLSPAAPAASTDKPSAASADGVSEIPLPHHPPVPSVEGQVETPVDPAPTPKDSALKVEPTPSLEPSSARDQDTAMTDVPVSPGKVARSRDEEETDEPATKRHKADDDSALAEFKMPGAPPAEASRAPQATSAPLPPGAPDMPGAVSSRTANQEYQKPITSSQTKHILAKVFGNLKRNKISFMFRQPVDPVALNIPTYPDVITSPMDLKTAEDKMKNNQYSTVDEVWDDLDLIVQNSITFNGIAHDVTKAAYTFRAYFDSQMANTPSAEQVEPKAANKKKRTSIEKPPARRRESRSSGGNAKSPVTAVAPSPTQTFALNPAGMPTIRRDSTITDGRPRREIHPPAPKDLPYTNQRPRKKKFLWELKWCQDVINEFKKPKYHAMAWPFMQPVDPVALNIPTYHKVVKKPMDIGTIETKLKAGEYENAKEFDADMRLVFANCYRFNLPDDNIYRAGKQMEALYEERIETRKQWLKDHAPTNVSSPGSSPEASDDEEASDDDEEEEEEEEEEDPQAAQIRNMEKQLEMLKQQMGDKKKKTPPLKSKKSKKGAKPPKKEAPAKKSKGSKAEKDKKSKKPGKIPYVTYEQKQAISARINDLPENRMATALAIIRDNMPNLKGVQDDEIELDIDELSNEVLYKLLQFVRKYAPMPDDEPIPRAAPAPTAASRPKKAKPMGKHEQEARIKELKEKLNGGHDAGSEEQDQAVDSSGDDDDSEESEED